MNKFITIFFALPVILTSCFQLFEVGQNTFLKEAPNKEKSKKAILFSKGRNATADNSLQVKVSDYDHILGKEEVGNTFTVDSDHNSTTQDINSINFTWLSRDTLQIDYDKKLRTFIQNAVIDDVVIKYMPR